MDEYYTDHWYFPDIILEDSGYATWTVENVKRHQIITSKKSYHANFQTGDASFYQKLVQHFQYSLLQMTIF